MANREEGFHSKATPYLCATDAVSAIEFYKKAFGATEIVRFPDASGKVTHAEIRVQGAPIMISDEFPEIDVRSPQTIGGSPVMVILEVEDVELHVRPGRRRGSDGGEAIRGRVRRRVTKWKARGPVRSPLDDIDAQGRHVRRWRVGARRHHFITRTLPCFLCRST